MRGLILLYYLQLFNDCSNTSWTYCTSTFTARFCLFRNLIVTVFAVLWLILWVFYLLFSLFPGECIKNVSRIFATIRPPKINITWPNSYVNQDFYKNRRVIHILEGVIHVFMYHDAYFTKWYTVYSIFYASQHRCDTHSS